MRIGTNSPYMKDESSLPIFWLTLSVSFHVSVKGLAQYPDLNNVVNIDASQEQCS